MAENERLDILVVGGSGFVSGTVARVALSSGHQVWTITRGQRPVPEGVTSLVADRQDMEAFAQAVGGAGKRWDLVVDCIGFEPADARQDLNIFRARADHLVFLSSDFVFEPLQRHFPQAEESEQYSYVGYGGGKRLCELEFIGGDAGDMHWTVLRPCHIYGPGSLLGCLPTHGRDPQLIEKMKTGQLLELIGGGHFLQQPIFANDLAELVLSCHDRDVTYGEIFCCAGPDIVESRTYYQIVAEVIGVELRIKELSVSTYLAEEPDAAPFLCHRIYDMAKLEAAELAVPSTPLAEGLPIHVKSILG